VGVIGVRPTGDQSQPLVGEGMDPFTVLALLLSGDVFVREDKLLLYRISVWHLPDIESDLVTRFKVNSTLGNTC
jgi:hypothetical protein